MKSLDFFKRPSFILFVLVLSGSVILSVLAYRTVVGTEALASPTVVVSHPQSTPTKALPTATPTSSLTLLPVQDSSHVLGIDGDSPDEYAGVSWLRMGYPSCGWGNLKGETLRDTIEAFHKKGIRVLLTVCQGSNGANLFDPRPLADAAQGNADAVQCGNEEMKQDPSVAFLYIPPENFAKFYNLCEQAVHAVRPDTPVLLGSLDPHVGGVDYQPLVDQVNYLDQMQDAMNTSVHPGGNWDWHNQTLGLIDSWHNGYPDASVNSLAGLFDFWSQQFHVDLNSGQLGQHLWVVEGTGCFKGCGINSDSAYQVAVSHVLTLITDVKTAMQDKVPFFYFSGKDFFDQGTNWPIGILDTDGHPKPIRQDLAMGARTLTLSCPNGSATVSDQLQLLAKMYASCTLPDSYISTLTS